MTRGLSGVMLPAFVLLALLLGGSSNNLWQSAVLQFVGILLIAWAAALPQPERIGRDGRILLALSVCALVLVLLQLIPLSPALWRGLPGREPVVLGYTSLGYPLPCLPLSIAPEKTVQSAFGIIPPLAAMLAVIALRAHRERWIAGAVIVGALGSVLLGAMQAASPGPEAWVYIYKYTSPGAVGFFSNRNHMATLLLAAIPFAAALFAAGHPQLRSRTVAIAMVALGGGGLLLIIVGLVLNGSLAALALAAPVFAFSALLVPAAWRYRRLLVPMAALAFVAAVAVLATSWIGSAAPANVQTDSLYSRGQIWTLTFRAIASHFPLGTGLGTFTGVYALNEDPAATTVAWVNHVHNDYLELLLETGLPGLLLMVAFLAWFVLQTVRVWNSPFASLFGKAATIAAAAMLAHSIVDYPLRTTGLAVLFGACLGMMAQPSRQSRSDEARHVKIG
jgi:O-antigen ligase